MNDYVFTTNGDANTSYYYTEHCQRCNDIVNFGRILCDDCRKVIDKSTGWICPKCGKVWSPSVKMCDCVGQDSVKPIEDNLDSVKLGGKFRATNPGGGGNG